ncbi:uncharacterized protein MYCGRDRAFT_95039 [Zymoseptoria tritici IPO323]|uniref:Secreted protein n=1 Tax=Zymoseptoria tritici (strain CBS 115943 / IPO323) TaxID=336722 RepID=F9XH47_ZYMTI|nr:uncharacterized protein MYCGRDRAFT_95039 [Zymoseptoria tritici IPO323]EGP84941.1 hypothetical protein MYCGRDRAFT_95039 [Zymoseptoria tritici IPO323]
MLAFKMIIVLLKLAAAYPLEDHALGASLPVQGHGNRKEHCASHSSNPETASLGTPNLHERQKSLCQRQGRYQRSRGTQIITARRLTRIEHPESVIELAGQLDARDVSQWSA